MRTEFEILGLPAPQGSKTAVMHGNRPGVIEGGSKTGRAKHKAWRNDVAAATADVARTTRPVPMVGPLAVSLWFRLPMPKSRRAAVRKAGIGPSIVRPDVDKLVRATLDGLVDGGLIKDDSHVTQLFAEKVETTGWTGCEVRIEQAEIA